jgi:hypothetical protein
MGQPAVTEVSAVVNCACFGRITSNSDIVLAELSRAIGAAIAEGGLALPLKNVGQPAKFLMLLLGQPSL